MSAWPVVSVIDSVSKRSILRWITIGILSNKVAMRYVTPNFGGLWSHAEFRKLWIGQSSSLFGSQIINLALPLSAAISLKASPFEMGLISAMSGLPAIFGFFLGAWVDRHKRRSILIGCDLGRALSIATVPIAYALGVLTIEFIYGISFVVGMFTMLFSIAYRSYLPSIVDRQDLV